LKVENSFLIGSVTNHIDGYELQVQANEEKVEWYEVAKGKNRV